MKHSTVKKTIYSVSIIFILVILWVVITTTQNNDLIFPSLKSITEAFLNLFKGSNLSSLLATFLRLLISIAIAMIVALIITFLYIWRPNSYAFFSPIIKIMRSVPFVCFSIFVLIIFGSKLSPYIICGLVVTPIAVQGLLTAVDGIDKALLEDLALLDNSFTNALYYVYIPLIKNSIIMTLLQTFGLGFKVIVMGEYLAQTSNSIGKALYFAKSYQEINVVLAWAIMIVIIVALIELAIKKVDKRLNK